MRIPIIKNVTLKISKSAELIGLKKVTKDNNVLFYINDSSKSNFKTAGISKMYDAIMKISPQPMFIYDIENLKFMEVNDAAIKLYGYSKEEFLNMDLTDIYAPEDIQTLLESANKKSKTNEFTGPWRHMKKDGTAIIVELSKSPMDYKGKSAHINIIRDITDEVKNSKKIKMFRAAFENSSDLIFITDNDGFITYASDSVINNLGYSKHDLDKKPFLSLLKDEKRAELNKDLIHSDSKETKKIKTELKKATGQMLEVNLVASPIFDYNGEKIQSP
ncbi:MAG: PAS domain S-box protein [Melioribacteraceae bacterium]|nr:PAS domain S-box protein [Melioribacteraceae bacterium]